MATDGLSSAAVLISVLMALVITLGPITNQRNMMDLCADASL
jgi:hypothetical protein